MAMNEGEGSWYKEFFGEDYLRIYLPMFTRTSQEVEGIVSLLGLPTGSAILDLCCGHGRHAILLAQRGYRVTGQDLSEVFLSHAQADAEAQGVQVDWVHSDMRSIPFENTFDAVYNMFTAFGYLESEEEDQKVLQQVHIALKPRGLFLLETMYRDGLWRRFMPHEINRYDDGLIVLEERVFNPFTSRMNVQVTMIFPDGRKAQYHHAARLYTLTEYAHMLARVGLKVQAYYGGLDGSKLTLDSRRLVVVAQKASEN
jgi:SAM-dependent methyltransferase